MLKYSFFILLATLSFFGCQKRPNQSVNNGILFKINNQPVLAEEFIYLYEKNNFNNSDIYSKEDIDSYLDLFINFKLKVKAAYEEGIDTTEAYRQEFQTYRAELIKPYLLQTRERDSLVKETYDRLQTFIHASHILIRVDDFNASEGTLEAYRTIAEIRNKALAGEDFNALAREFSQDPSAKKNGGDLGFFTAMRMVYPFEEAAYNTPVDGISGIIKTQFGYHILKVHDKVPNMGKVKVAHIMIKKDEGNPTRARDKAFEIHEKAVAGGDWSYLVAEFSDDERTKQNAGELGFIHQGQLPPDFQKFEQMAFQLNEENSLSEPVESPYGWHILKLLEKAAPETFEELKPELERTIARGDRAEFQNAHIIDRLKGESNFKENTALLDQIAGIADSKENWKQAISDSLEAETLFLLNRQSVPLKDFVAFMENQPQNNAMETVGEYVKKMYKAFVEKRLFEYEEQEIASKHLEYRMLEREYREGLLLFEIMQQNVWDKSVKDSVGLKTFFEEHRENYKWKDRAEAVLVKTDRADLADKIKSDVKGGRYIYFTKAFKNASDSTISAVLADQELLKQVLEYSKQYPSTKIIFEYNPNKVSSGQIQRLENVFAEKDLATEFAEKTPENDIFLMLSSEDPRALEEAYSESSQLTVQVEEGLFEKGDNNLLDQVKWEKGVYDLKDNDKFVVVKIKSVWPSRLKSLEEVRGKVISDFQSQLESEWIAALKDKYEVTVNEEVLSKIYKYFESK